MIDVASSREEFVARAVNHTVVPVRTALVSDDDTPVGAMTYSVARIRLRGRTVALKDRVRHVQAGAGSVREQSCCGYPGGSELRIAVRAAGG